MRRASAVVAAAVALAAGCVAPPSGEQRPPFHAARLGAADAVPGVAVADDADGAAAVDEREARAAALRLRVTGPQVYGVATGSGFAVGETTVVTNAHVVANGADVALTSWDGHDVDATVAATAVRHDLAALATDGPVPVEPLELADADPAEGDDVVVVGYPGGGRITVDDAEVLGIADGGDYADQLPGEFTIDRVVRLDVGSVRPGSSGGPVLNAAGEVVGVVSAVVVHREREVLAVPVTTLGRWLTDR